MSTQDRICETVSPEGEEAMIVEGPSEIASWFWTATEELLDKRIAEALAKSADENARK
jgi:hypothetical protein